MSESPLDILFIDTTEEFVLNPASQPERLRGYRHYRLEYGGPNEDCLYEGRLILPPHADPDAIVQLLMGMDAHEQMWEHHDVKPTTS